MDNIFYSLEDGCYKTYPDGDEATGNQIREVLEDKEKTISKLQQENKQLKDNWNKLKEWLKEYEEGTYGLGSYETGLSDGLGDVIKKMQELEGSDSDE